MFKPVETALGRSKTTAPRRMLAGYRTSFHDRVWGLLEGIDKSHHSSFDVVVECQGRHPGKLNLLAQVILAETEDEGDLIMFMDGDAFPIVDPVPLVSEALATTQLVAVRRQENLADPQPQPCFCSTTVGFWRSLCGDWSAGYSWVNSIGDRVTDVGATCFINWKCEGPTGLRCYARTESTCTRFGSGCTRTLSITTGQASVRR